MVGKVRDFHLLIGDPNERRSSLKVLLTSSGEGQWICTALIPFEVARPRQIEVSSADKILIRANDKRLGLTSGQVLTVSCIAPDVALQTKEGLCVPADFGNGAMAR